MRDLTLSLPLAGARPKIGGFTKTQKLNVVLCVGIILLGLGYVYSISALGTKGYEIKGVESRLQVLEDEQKKLRMESSDLQSINQVQSQAAIRNFVPVTNVTYIKDPNFALK